ncbi:L-threonylcarbamoyladenylate synthase [Agaricicola taiwanensis]|nr:L-threonylcarbamoyladenylate synthase [Agaricicola taiwanensis]
MADDAGVSRAAELLSHGGLVSFPTETVYGLGADATDATAVAQIFAAKERPSFNPLIVHVPDVAAAQKLGRFDDQALLLARTFWPGPFTLVVPALPDSPVAALTSAGLDSIALRVPSHPVARRILAMSGKPIAAPSANRSGRISPTTAAHVLADLDGRLDAVLDGGATNVGVESTIVACHGEDIRLLRPGGIPREAVEALLGHKLISVADTGDAAPRAPGMLASHYAPAAGVRLDAVDVRPGEAWLGFGGLQPGGAEPVMSRNLSAEADLVAAAAALFSALHALDASGARSIAVAPIPKTGLGEAINDRLSRAAAPRPGKA